MLSFIKNIFKRSETDIRTDRVIYLIRGIPGSGKSAFAADLSMGIYPVFEADQFFMKEGVYEFDRNRLGAAHKWCQESVESSMKHGDEKIFVSNTSILWRDMKPYYDLASTYEYRVYSCVVENRHSGVDVHGVPEETLVRMEQNLRNNIVLRKPNK